MTIVASQPEARATPAEPAKLLRALLEESRELTAVERFAKAHDTLDAPAQAKHYRDLIPDGPPGKGHQYAFDVDLDACSGCKACVSACHHMNGLEPEETWRAVGQLYGSNGLPVIQHVTTACHHCVDPGCLRGCPTNAYEKDAVTGIVRHLDDQCFGCQYCTMACPYEVPQYSPSKGIVRKCDMCHGRLVAGEAPACVAACPNKAIRITSVDVAESTARTKRGLFLPDTPPSQLTNPTTVYRTSRGLPANATGADANHAEAQHAHAPLVVMLVLTQMSVGMLAGGAFAGWLGAGGWADAMIVGAGVVGQLGLGAAPLHLGRPHLAFRAVLGWRHSWLSREAIAFGVYAGFSVATAAMAALPYITDRLPASINALLDPLTPAYARPAAEALAILSGVAAVYCSAKIYMFTARVFWIGRRTLVKFFGTAIVLGLTSTAMAAAIGGAALWMAWLAAGAIMLKLVYEGSLLSDTQSNDPDLRLTGGLHRGPLLTATRLRRVNALGAVTCLALACIGPAPTGFAVVALIAAVTGELAERWLYFAAVVPLRMPGGAPS